jgi:hypothetical protein
MNHQPWSMNQKNIPLVYGMFLLTGIDKDSYSAVCIDATSPGFTHALWETLLGRKHSLRVAKSLRPAYFVLIKNCTRCYLLHRGRISCI